MLVIVYLALGEGDTNNTKSLEMLGILNFF